MSLKISHLFFFDQASFRNFKKPRKQPIKRGFQAITQPKGQQTIKVVHRPQKAKRSLTASAVSSEKKEDGTQARDRLSSGANVLNAFTSLFADEVEHMQYFEKMKAAAPSLLNEIDAMILHCKIAGIPFPRGLENILNYSWNDLIKDVSYNKKRWPTAVCKATCVPRKPNQKLSQTSGSIVSTNSMAISSTPRSRSVAISEDQKEKPRIKMDQRLGSASTVKEVKKAKKAQEHDTSSKSSPLHGYTINFSISSKVYLDQGWITKTYDETIAKLNWREIYTLMLEKLQAENAKINFEKAMMMKYGFDKPVILLHYEEAKIEPRFRKYLAMPEMPLVKDGKPIIPNLKVENPALSKLHYALNDGSAIIYYPSGNIAVCRSHSGLSCQGTFYTNIFNDSTLQPVLLASFTPFGHGSVFLADQRRIVLQFHEQGGLMIDEDKTTLKNWQWPRRGKLPEPIWVKVNDYITIWIIAQFSIHFTFKWQYETIRFPLSPLLNVIAPQPDELIFRKRSTVQRSATSPRAAPEITIHYLRQLHRKIKNIINDWMEYYRIETGLSKFPFVRRSESERHISKVQPKKQPFQPYMPAGKGISAQADYARFLSTPGQEQNKCVPRSCTFTRGLAAMISREGNIGLLMSNRHGSSTRADIKQGHHFPKVPKEDKEWLLSPSLCPVALRAAMLGTGKKHCHCSTTKVPDITDLEFDTFIKRSTAANEQLVIVCVVALHHLKPAPYEKMIQYLYEENNRNRNQPCVECQSDSFRLLKYSIGTAHKYTGQSPVLLVKRHNVTPGMFLMYIRGKLLFADHIFNGYSNSLKDLMKQITKTYDDYTNGRYLLYDFRFSSTEPKLPSTTQDDTSLQHQPDRSARPKSETSIKPETTCSFQSANRAATIQDFIAFSLTQRNICCNTDRIPSEIMESMLESCSRRPN
ncbi:uncharacterized protein LOC122561441 [Chiloscyllium plagiosum]|uniref:uncharacterized protein LOC122561441 n=1 Tax=Chiloscyllium plagiosum TaxID=36176 RepID=UPI001CB883ED|nr:uncharacterized protein LOC122561441 [Chiloscyllium plagiosum]